MPSRLRVAFGYGVGLVVLALARPVPLSLLLGLPLAILGEAIRLWASGHIEKTEKLATGGPYAHTRNPLYAGSFLMALGLGVAAASPWVVVAVSVYAAAFYPALIREEAEFVRKKFPAEYEAWAREVPALWPRLRAAGPRSSRFTWERVRRNREWRTALALPAALALFAVRRVLPF